MRGLTHAEVFEALDDLTVKNILSVSLDEFRAVVVARGGDPDAVAAEARAGLGRGIRETKAARATEKVLVV